MSRKLMLDGNAKTALKSGVDKVADAVRVTLGPQGRNVVIDRSKHNLSPLITNDGVTIAREIALKDSFENMGARLMIEVATKTNDTLGDGTTTAIVLTQELVREGFQNIESGANPILLRRGMKKALDCVVSELDRLAQKVNSREDIKCIATVASKDDYIGELIATAMDSLPRENAFITIEDSKTMKTEVQVINGMRLMTGYTSRVMCTDKSKSSVSYMQPYILIIDKEITDIEELLPIMKKVVEQKANLLMIAKDIKGEALNTIVLNVAKGIIHMTAIKGAGYGRMQRDIMEDIAVYTGGSVIDEYSELSLRTVELTMLGRAESIQIKKDDTVILNGYGDRKVIEKRIQFIKAMKKATDSEFNKERFRERISKLSGGIAVIRVGASTQVEADEMKLRIEDAISSTKTAIAGGVLPGGGASYIYAQSAVKQLLKTLEHDELTGAQMIYKTLERPLWQIASNAGLVSEEIVSAQKEKTYPIGFDAKKERFVDLYEAGIIDPLNVSKGAIENAVSVASTLLTTEAVNIIVEGSETMPTG